MFRLKTGHPSTRSRPFAVVLWGVVVSTISPMASMAADPARFVPARGLSLFVDYEGLGSHAAAWKASAAYQILQGTPAGAMMADVTRQLLAPDPNTVRGKLMTGADFLDLGEFLVQHRFGLAVYEDDGDITFVIVLNGLNGGESRTRFERWIRFMLSDDAKTGELPASGKFRDRNLYRIGDREAAEGKPGDEAPNPNSRTRWTWWFEGDDLIWVVGPTDDSFDPALIAGGSNKRIAEAHRGRVAAVLDTIEGKQPNATTLPAHVAARAEGRDLLGFEPNGLFFAESRSRLGKGVLSEVRDKFESHAGLPKGDTNEFDLLEAMDISRARRIVGRWGFRGKSLLTDIRFEAPAPWGGVLSLLNPAGFRKDRIPPIPRSMGAFVVGAFARGDLNVASASLAAKVDARYRESFKAFDQAIRNGTGQRLRDNLFRHLGPTACLFAAPGESKDTADSTVASVLIAMDNADEVARALDALASQINTYYRGLEDGAGQGGERAAVGRRPAVVLERLPAPDRGYRLTSPAGLIPWITEDLQPTILLGKSYIAVANNPALARAAIAAESRPADRWTPTGELVKMFESLPANVAYLNVGNPRDSFWPDAIGNFPELLAPLKGNREWIKPVSPEEAARAFKVPKVDDLRALLFPSVLAAIVDDHNFRVISLEALPIGCLRAVSTQNFFLPGQMTIEFKFAPRR
jgi:hypothetical protein